MALCLDTEIQYVKGVGPKLGSLFSRNGIKTVFDLLQNYPRAYEDRRAARTIASLKVDDVVSVKAVVASITSYAMGKSSRKIYDIMVKDGSGQIRCKFFRVPYRGYFERFKAGTEVRIIGKVTDYRGRAEFHHPDMKDIEANEEELADALIPIYVETEGLSSGKIQKLVHAALEQIAEWPAESIPTNVVAGAKLISMQEAIRRIHHPEPELGNLYNDYNSEAHKRIIFEEFFWLEMFLASKRSGLKSEKGFSFLNKEILGKKLEADLPFKLTQAQQKSLLEIKKDLEW